MQGGAKALAVERLMRRSNALPSARCGSQPRTKFSTFSLSASDGAQKAVDLLGDVVHRPLLRWFTASTESGRCT